MIWDIPISLYWGKKKKKKMASCCTSQVKFGYKTSEGDEETLWVAQVYSLGS